MIWFLIIILLVILFWPQIVRFFSRIFGGFMARRYEDMLRRMMGMPSRKEEKRARKQASREGNRGSRRGENREQTRNTRNGVAAEMNSVAVDVEYTEIREFDSTRIAEQTPEGTRIYHEEQVSDAEFVEIRENSNKSK